MINMYIKDWKPDMPAAFITDDIAFVGGTPVSVHCFTSEDGLIILDTGFPGMLDGIAENLKKIGLDIKDVKHIIHSHGHIDHYGTTAEMARISGAKTYIGKEDAAIVTGEEDLSWAKELNLDPGETFTPDVLFSDGETLAIGGRKIRCVRAPGHTQGTYALFVETKVNGQPMIAAMHGGVGLNSMTREFLESYSMPLSIRDEFRAGLHSLSNAHVDIVLGNHPEQSSTAEKLEKLGNGENPFVNPAEWPAFLRTYELKLDEMLASEQK